MKIFLASHGKLASGVKSSLNILLGNSDKVTVFDAYLDDRNVAAEVEKFYETVSEYEEVLLLSDLYGGSVNQVLFACLQRENTRLVAGVNLAFVLEVAIREAISDEELSEIVNQSREMLRIVINDDEEVETEDFF
ncbi:MAG: PTS sugar transporter subunit IIA [Anaerorhabdus sp.]